MFAEGLRELRRHAGSPSYRTLARHAHFAPTTLSSAASGSRLPSLDVTIAYVTACGGEEEPWRQRWHEVAAELAVTAPPPEDPPRKPGRRRLLYAAAAAIVVTGTVLLIFLVPDNNTTTSAGVADGSDPKQSGCATDGQTLTAATITLGTLELRYSPSCRVAWARYTPNPGTPATPVVLRIEREQPRVTAVEFTVEVRDLAVYSDVLRTEPGCVRAHITITAPGDTPLSASTDCATGP